jgi:hypothetical protein
VKFESDHTMTANIVIADQNFTDHQLATEIILQIDRHVRIDRYYNTNDLIRRLLFPRTPTPPNLVLLEYELPTGGATEVVKRLEEAGMAGQIKLAIWGNETVERYEELCVRWDVEGCFSKKDNFSALKKALREVLL